MAPSWARADATTSDRAPAASVEGVYSLFDRVTTAAPAPAPPAAAEADEVLPEGPPPGKAAVASPPDRTSRTAPTASTRTTAAAAARSSEAGRRRRSGRASRRGVLSRRTLPVGMPGLDRDPEATTGRAAVVQSSGSSSGSGPSQRPDPGAPTCRSTGAVGRGGQVAGPSLRTGGDEDGGDVGEAGDAACRAASIRLQISGGTGPGSSARSSPRTRSASESNEAQRSQAKTCASTARAWSTGRTSAARSASWSSSGCRPGMATLSFLAPRSPAPCASGASRAGRAPWCDARGDGQVPEHRRSFLRTLLPEDPGERQPAAGAA